MGQNVAANNLAAIDFYEQGDQVTIARNTIENSGYQAISMSDSGQVTVDDNKIRDAHYNVAQPAIYAQAYNHDTTVRHDVKIINNDIDWQYGAGIQIQGAAGQLGKDPKIGNNRIKGATYGIHLYYVDGADLFENTISGSSSEGIRVRASDGKIRISGGAISDSTSWHVRLYSPVATMDLDIIGVDFDNCDTTYGLNINGARNVKYIGNTHNNSTTYATLITACTGKVTLIGNSYDKVPSITNNAIQERVADGFLTTGGFQRLASESSKAIEADASTTITLSIPVDSRILGVQLRVDSELAALETWDAAFSGGSTAAIASAKAVAKNTKVTLMWDDASATTPITTNTTNIAITKNGGGNFTAQGTISAIVYYEVMTEMADLP